MPILIVTSVAAEADAIGPIEGVNTIISGVGRTNAAAATTEAIVRSRVKIDAVLNAGVAGALPGSNLKIGDCLPASSCIYHEAGVFCAGGCRTIASSGLP